MSGNNLHFARTSELGDRWRVCKSPQRCRQRTPVFEITFGRGFEAWLAEQGTSIAFTTYQTGEDFIR
jgi:hypothetical protein